MNLKRKTPVSQTYITRFYYSDSQVRLKTFRNFQLRIALCLCAIDPFYCFVRAVFQASLQVFQAKFQLADSITAYITDYVYLFDTKKQPYLHISMLEYDSIIEKLYNLCNTLYNNCTEVLHIGHAAGPL